MWKTASFIAGIVLVLLAFGIIMLASTSALHGVVLYKDPNFFIKKQILASVVGLLGAIIASRVNYHYWRIFSIFIALGTLVMLVMVLIPGVGLTIKGSSRWLRGPGVNIQPSEFAKLAVILTLAAWYSLVQRKADTFWKGFVWPGLIMVLFALPILMEPDFGTTMLIGVVGLSIMFIGGASKSWLSVATVTGACGFLYLIMQSAERMGRFFAYIDPIKHAKDDGFQLLNALYGFVVGGFPGVGLGASLQKQFYLPEAHTDFIYAIIGEELGFVASMGILLMFVLFFFAGLRVSLGARDMFGRLAAFGITCSLSLQAAMNMAVVTGCMPTKGIPLPFISFGGTAMVVNLIMVGILLNIALQAGGTHENDDIPAVKDQHHEF